MEPIKYISNGVEKETTDKVVLDILEELRSGSMNAEEASMHARTYLLSKQVGRSDDQLLENLDVYAAVLKRIYGRPK
jgi:hypothetical protein